MQIVDKQISLADLRQMSQTMFGGLVKAVIDVEKGIMAVDAELHADEETLLLENGSQQSHLWGINLYPEFVGSEDFIEFDSMINLRPTEGNRSRGVDDQQLQEAIRAIVDSLVSQ